MVKQQTVDREERTEKSGAGPFLLASNMGELRDIGRRINSYLRDRYGKGFKTEISFHGTEDSLYDADEAEVEVNRGGEDAEDIVRHYMVPLCSAGLQLMDMLTFLKQEVFHEKEYSFPMTEINRYMDHRIPHRPDRDFRSPEIDGRLLFHAKESLEGADRAELRYNLDRYLEEREDCDYYELSNLERGTDKIIQAYRGFIGENGE